MTRAATPKLGAYATLAGTGLLAALVLGRPELAALAAPFAVVLAAGLSLAQEPRVRATLELDRERQVEGEEVKAYLELQAERAVPGLELLLDLPDGVEAVGPNPQLRHLAHGERPELELSLRCAHWGAYLVGDLLLRVRDRFGLLVFEQALDLRRPLKVYPRGETLERLLRPLETQTFAGTQTPRTRGEGIEFADLRPFVPGDRVRRVNWRATARRGEPWVNETHPERNTDVIIFLDTFVEAREEEGESTLDVAVRAAATLADRYLKRKDRVGLIGFGGYLNWLLPGSGLVQLYRIVDSLLDTEIILSYAWKSVEVIPPRTLPPKALIFAVSPLLDERAVTTLLDLRARGFDLAVLEVSPVAFASAATGEREELAYRLWRLKRDALRAKYQRFGVPVVEWHEGEPLEGALAEVGAFRRQARYSRV